MVLPPGNRRARAVALAALVGVLLGGCDLGGTAADGDPSPTPSGASSLARTADPTDSATPLLNDAPDPNSTVGGLAPGFPSDLLPVPGGVEVLVSSVDPVGSSNAYQVSLNLRTVLSAADVVDVYRKSLTTAGFTEAEQTTPDAALAAQSTFTRSGGDELLVIGVLDRDGVRTVTIGGRLRSAT
ncbi:hypothetical protein [Pengzhenrongella phosphoraccumulans]|uniref:hypothetical protein n=1 Tax=Pengzhenrongella phosphoraccumulans TaxID=3114394 RepID=UPI00388E9301